jgi:hypothetical protein
MKYFNNYDFMVGAITLLSGILALACIIAGAMAVEYDFDAFTNPVLVLDYAQNYRLAELFLYLDMFGYYLLLLPVIFYLHKQYKYGSPWINLFTFSGLAYVLTGATGAAMLAAFWPGLMQDYLLPANENNAVLIEIFKAITLLVTKGFWNMLEVIFAAVWWIGTGRLLYKEKRILGVVTIAAGIFTLADAIGNIAGYPLLAETGLNFYLLLGIAWPVYIGIVLIRKAIFSKAIPDAGNLVSHIKNQAHEPLCTL